MTVVWEEPHPGSNLSAGSFVFITKATAIYNLGQWHGMCTITAVPSFTQPSTLRETVKLVSSYWLSSNKWRRWMRMVAAFSGGLTV